MGTRELAGSCRPRERMTQRPKKQVVLHSVEHGFDDDSIHRQRVCPGGTYTTDQCVASTLRAIFRASKGCKLA